LTVGGENHWEQIESAYRLRRIAQLFDEEDKGS
jgi:hypothetical protein